ncbi:M48 family metalloprotease [Blastococcus tunisiensis]|uniref:STE24 endopeptidase n=1 Tax=Blastococcus tunisiensis TaxID=1798228 RepID=A0A1I2EPP6_9ACTN|nr:M48 family metalloprotease [Blastococcus sp. DSM 46838]SFE94456.1 STE24 endopeptidase [Blastococcus sp. DSM 46838]
MKHSCEPPRHSAEWRLLCAAPAILLSAMLVTVTFSWLGPYTLLTVAAWLLLVPVLLLTRPLERLAVGTAYRFRMPTGRDAEWLTWLQQQAENRCEVAADRLDWYVRTAPAPNAFAVGLRSIAVTTGFLHLLYTGRLTPEQAVAVALHEVGHHITRGPRYGLIADWLTLPWQSIYRAAIRIGHTLPLSGVGTMLMPMAFVVAIVDILREDRPPEHVVPVLITLITVAIAVTVSPVAEAAACRAGERAADSYAASLGAGPDLARALDQVAPCHAGTLIDRPLASHPATAARQLQLSSTPPSLAHTGPCRPGLVAPNDSSVPKE